MGNVHARHYGSMPHVHLFAWDRDADKLGAFCKHHSATPANSYEDLLNKVSLVDICLPSHLHCEFALDAIRSKTPCLVEKPMGRTLEECRQMVAVAESEGVPLGVGHVVRFFPEHSMAHQLVKEGKVGKPSSVRLRRGGLAPLGSDAWFRDSSKSGGVILDLAIHDFDWLRWTLGECTQVFARSVRLGAAVEDATFEGDYALCTLSFESGAVAHVESTWMDPAGFRTTLEVAGSDGLIEFDSRKTPAVRVQADNKQRNESNMHRLDDPYYRQLSAVVSAVVCGQPMPVSGKDGLAAVSIALAAIESAKTGRPIKPEVA